MDSVDASSGSLGGSPGGAVVGFLIGALVGSAIGIAGFGTAISGTVPNQESSAHGSGTATTSP